MYELYYKIRKAYKNWKRRRLRPTMYNFGANFRQERGFRFTSLLLIFTILACAALIILYFTGPLKPFVNNAFGISNDPIRLTPTPPGMTQTPGPAITGAQDTPTPTPDPLPSPTASPVYLSWITPMPIPEDAEVAATGISKVKLNVRTHPDDALGEIIGILAKSQKVYILELGDPWLKIVFADGWGYAYADYIRINEEVALPDIPGLPQLS